ncbi:MAG: SIS domain-containing protein, partial [Elusimicrobia bacterium]|nr:SIS domain-containing protein [Elusimicrobiota bacterium]
MDSQTAVQLITARLEETRDVYQATLKNPDLLKTIALITEKVTSALRNNRRVVVFGNGGSAADAQHFAAELVGGFANHHRR